MMNSAVLSRGAKEKRGSSLTFSHLNKINALLMEDLESSKIKAANMALDALRLQGKVGSAKDSDKVMNQVLRALLNSRNYLAVATLLWGRDVFDVRPRSVKMIFDDMMNSSKLAIIGGSSVSKTYSAGGWILIDWLFYPERTNVKLASISEDHLRGNIFAHLISLHQSSAIKLPGEVQSMYIGMDPKQRDYGISGVIYPQGTASTGRLKGFKPKPTHNVHPILKTRTTRLRVLLDEAQNSTEGIFADFPSLEASISGTENVKIVMCLNPEDMSHATGKLTRPKGGWEAFDMETDERWVSEQGWNVLRIDPKQTENVIHQKIIYPNFQSYETYCNFLSKGDTSPEYYTFGRGCFPMRGTYNTVVPRNHLISQQGSVRFLGDAVDVASVDVALVRDKLVFTKGRWGLANEVVRPDGRIEKFEDPADPGKYVSRHILQVEQQYEIPVQNDTVKTGNEIIRLCRKLGVQARWLGIDSTGSGISIYHHLKHYFGDVLPIQWAESATEKKILHEDIKTPVELYDRLASELWFATATWLEHGVIFISYEVDEDPLFNELNNRRFNGRGTKGRQRVESKEDYKKRNTVSPDHADSLVMLQQVVRERGDVLPGMFTESKTSVKSDGAKKFKCRTQPKNLMYVVELSRNNNNKR